MGTADMSDTTFRFKKWLFRIVLVLILVIIALSLFITWVLPWYLQSRLLPQSQNKAGLTADQIHIRRIGLIGADLGPLSIRVDGRPAVQIDAVRVDYTPWRLLEGDIDRIVVDGLRLTVDIGRQVVDIGGFKVPLSGSKSSPPSNGPVSLEKGLPVQIKSLGINNALIDIHWADTRIQVPLEMDLNAARLRQGRLQARVRLTPRGNPLVLSLALDQDANTFDIRLDRSRLLMDSMADLAEIFIPSPPGGTLEARGRVRGRLSPLQVESVDLAASLSHTRITQGPWQARNLPGANGEPVPIGLRLAMRDPQRIDWSCGPVQFTGPMTMTLDRLQGSVVDPLGSWNASASGIVRLPSQPLPVQASSPASLQKDLNVQLEMKARHTAENAMAFELAARPRNAKAPLILKMADAVLNGNVPNANIRGTFRQSRLTSKLQMALNGLAVSVPGMGLQIPRADLAVDLSADSVPGSPAVDIDATTILSDILGTSGTTKAMVPQIRLHTRIVRRGKQVPAMSGTLSLSRAKIEDPARRLTVDGVNIELPIRWPGAPKTDPGRLTVRSVVYQDRPLGDLKGRLTQQGYGLKLEARQASKLIRGLNVSIQSRMDVNGATVNFMIPAFDLEKDLDLGQLAAPYAGYVVGGRIAAGGKLDIRPGSISGSAFFDLTEGAVHQEALDLDLTGIKVHMAMDDLINLRSGPGQKLQIESLRLGDITAQKFNADFQLEPGATLLIERAGMKWCRGQIDTNALRIRPGVADYDITLICDRLNLAMVLQQLGAAKGEGEGTVNGVIPIHWTGGQLTFDNGFLYSTPGEPGTIALQGTDFLLSGLPPGSPQRTQLDIATEALKDYTYNWAKLNLESQDDILLIKLQLDGKPNRLLPFAYDKKLGRLIRITGKGQAEFKGVSIDLNFRSPINEILHYKEMLNPK